MSKAEKRIRFIDIARGLGIILVVLGHNHLIYHPPSHIYYIIFLFHMPLFFFLSGIVHKNQDDYLLQLKKRSKGLLLPYFSTSFLWMLVLIVYSQITGKPFYIGYYIKTTLYSTGVNLDWNVLWYLTSLFCTHIAYLWIDMLILKKMKSFSLRFLFMAVLLFVGIFIMRKLWYFKTPIISSIGFFSNGIPGCPWSLDLVPITVFFYYLGTESKRLHHKMESTVLFVLSSLLFFGLYFSTKHHLDLNIRIYDSAVINSLEAVFGILIIMYLSKIIDRSENSLLCSTFCYLGRLSLVIFIFHRQFQDRVYYLVSQLENIPVEIAGGLSFIMGIFGPVLLYEVLLKRIHLLRICYSIKGPAIQDTCSQPEFL